jgi:hypothetical protein
MKETTMLDEAAAARLADRKAGEPEGRGGEMPAAVAGRAIPEAGQPSRVYGVIDHIGRRVAGWAIDRASSAAAVEVDIYREGELIATVRADRHRRDLESGGLGTGLYGFRIELETPVEPGFEFTVTAVARAADGESAALRRNGGQTTDPDRRLLERTFEKLVDLRVRMDEMRAAMGAANGGRVAETMDLLGRIELAQIRLESTLGKVDAPPAPASRGLRVWVAVAVLVGVGSLALGVVSMLAG